MGNLIFYQRVLEMGGGCFFLLRNLLPGDFSENQSFEQRIAAKPVCAVQPGRGDFTAGVKTLDVRFGCQVGFYAADHIMSARPDRDKVVSDVDIETFEKLVNPGKSFREKCFFEVPDVQINMRRFGFSHLGQDCPADYIARSKLGVRGSPS